MREQDVRFICWGCEEVNRTNQDVPDYVPVETVYTSLVRAMKHIRETQFTHEVTAFVPDDPSGPLE